MQTLKAWGMRPSDFGFCETEEDLAWMRTYDRVEAEMTDYESYVIERNNG